MKVRLRGISCDPSGRFACVDKTLLRENLALLPDFDLRAWLRRVASVGADGMVNVKAGDFMASEWEEPLSTSLIQ